MSPAPAPADARAGADNGAADPRRRALLDAAVATFLRYGLKKTSMDDVAAAAHLSRQGLYLHFASKDVLFRSAVLHLVTESGAAARAALAQEGADLVDVVVAAFVAQHGVHFTAPIAAEHMAELVDAAHAAVGDALADADAAFADALAARLKRAGLKRTRDRALALIAAATGLKHRRDTTLHDYTRDLRSIVALLVAEARPT